MGGVQAAEDLIKNFPSDGSSPNATIEPEEPAETNAIGVMPEICDQYPTLPGCPGAQDFNSAPMQ